MVLKGWVPIASKKRRFYMTVMGIDVSKGKSTIAAVNNNGELVLGPYDVEHNERLR